MPIRDGLRERGNEHRNGHENGHGNVRRNDYEDSHGQNMQIIMRTTLKTRYLFGLLLLVAVLIISHFAEAEQATDAQKDVPKDVPKAEQAPKTGASADIEAGKKIY